MKPMVAAFIVAVLVGLVPVFLLIRGRKTATPTRSVATPELRQKLLTSSPRDFGIQATPGAAWGIVMDTGYPEATASLISLIDGTASLYFSSGGGMIGGQGQPPVREAAVEFVRTATKHLGSLSRTLEHPLPEVGKTAFYVLTPEGLFTSQAAEEDLGEGRHPLSPLFYAGQNVITHFRLVSELADR